MFRWDISRTGVEGYRWDTTAVKGLGRGSKARAKKESVAMRLKRLVGKRLFYQKGACETLCTTPQPKQEDPPHTHTHTHTRSQVGCLFLSRTVLEKTLGRAG